MSPSPILHPGDILISCCYAWIVDILLLQHTNLQPIICNVALDLIASYIRATETWRKEINCYIDARKETRIAPSSCRYILEALPFKRGRGGTNRVPQFAILSGATQVQSAFHIGSTD